MNAGNLIFLLLIVGGLFAMFFMHRGGHAHGDAGHGGHAEGGMGCCGGHGDKHGGSSTDEHQEEDKKPPLATPGPHSHDHEPAVTDAGRSGS